LNDRFAEANIDGRMSTVGPERQFATFGSSRSRAISSWSSVAARDPTLASNSNFLNDVGEVKFQSRAAVRQEKGQGRVSATTVIRQPNSKGSRQSEPVTAI
jgi:hypothetical protein